MHGDIVNKSDVSKRSINFEKVFYNGLKAINKHAIEMVKINEKIA